MAKILYVHWNEAEAAAHAEMLAASGHEVVVHASTDGKFSNEWLPDALVISLDRLPSHGRAVAEWFWEAKKRRHIPIIFTGGKPD